MTTTNDKLECLRDHGQGECQGEVTIRYSDLGAEIPECEKHMEESYARIDQIRSDYPDSPIAPRWFDPTVAGERWDDDY